MSTTSTGVRQQFKISYFNLVSTEISRIIFWVSFKEDYSKKKELKKYQSEIPYLTFRTLSYIVLFVAVWNNLLTFLQFWEKSENRSKQHNGNKPCRSHERHQILKFRVIKWKKLTTECSQSHFICSLFLYIHIYTHISSLYIVIVTFICYKCKYIHIFELIIFIHNSLW